MNEYKLKIMKLFLHNFNTIFKLVYMRLAWNILGYFEYLKNQLQLIREDIIMHAGTDTLPQKYSVGSEIPPSQLMYCMPITFIMTK